jgi:hypothetical protein
MPKSKKKKKPAKKVAKKVAKKAAKKVARKPAKKVAKRPAKKVAKRAGKKVAKKKPARKVAKKPAAKAAKVPATKASKKPADKAATKPAVEASPKKTRPKEASASSSYTSIGSTDLGEREFEVKHPHAQLIADELGERMAESSLLSITGGDDDDFERSDEIREADVGGPFRMSDGGREFSDDDFGVPDDAEVSGTPTVMGEPPLDPETALEEAEEGET